MENQDNLEQAALLIKHFAAYKAKFPEGNLVDFGVYLQHQDQHEPFTEEIYYGSGSGLTENHDLEERLKQLPFGESPIMAGSARWSENKPMEARLGILFRRMSRHANHNMKKVLEPLGLRNVEDFLYLSLAHDFGKASKSELIQAALSEFTGGIEIINRLLKLGFISEMQDENDKRKKTISVTEEGHAILFSCYGPFTKMSNLIYRGVTKDEMQYIYNILAGLDHMHSYIYQEKRHASLDELTLL
jgi:DNA-binding MarR family transcriptional regulator